MIVVSKNSRLYKTYAFLAGVMIFSIFTPKARTFNDPLPVFRDLCTFLRTTIFYIFLAIPMWALFIFSFLNLFYEAYISATTLTLEPTIGLIFFLGSVCLGLATLAGIVIGILTLIEKATETTSESTFYNITKEAIKSRHDKFCKIIKVKNSDD